MTQPGLEPAPPASEANANHYAIGTGYPDTLCVTVKASSYSKTILLITCETPAACRLSRAEFLNHFTLQMHTFERTDSADHGGLMSFRICRISGKIGFFASLWTSIFISILCSIFRRHQLSRKMSGNCLH